MTKICQPCIFSLETFYKFHLIATSSQDEILRALPTDDSKTDVVDDELVIEFLNVDYEVESKDGDARSDGRLSPETIADEVEEVGDELSCSFCSKTYKRKTQLERHIVKNHEDGTVKHQRNAKSIFCDLCGKKFTHHDEYQKHIQEIYCVSNDSPDCRFCKEVHTSVEQLQEHITRNHPKGREHFCPICFKSFPTVSNRNSHLQSHNADDTVKCSICSQGFKSILYLKKHHKAIHTKVDKTCHICDRKFDTQQKFDYHLKTHESVKRYKCGHTGCDKSFMQSHHLENHKTTHTGISKFLCFKCGKEFRQECNLKAHLKIHNADNETAFKCSFPDCGKTFNLNSSFRCHKKTHDKDSHSSQCPECGKKFSQRSSLRAHFQTHFRDPDNRPFKCKQPDCDRSFFQERSMKYHNSAAHGIGEPPAVKKDSTINYVCDFCQKCFKLQSLLKRHILIHIAEEQQTRKHKCDKCEASFKRPEHLRLHTNSVHLKFKPYKCEQAGCVKSFAQIGDRNVHMKIHLNDKPHVCTMCQKAFRLAKGLRAHEKVHANKKLREVEEHKDDRAPVCDGLNVLDEQETPTVHKESHQLVFVLTPLPPP